MRTALVKVKVVFRKQSINFQAKIEVNFKTDITLCWTNATDVHVVNYLLMWCCCRVEGCIGGSESTGWQRLLGVSWWSRIATGQSPGCWNGLPANKELWQAHLPLPHHWQSGEAQENDENRLVDTVAFSLLMLYAVQHAHDESSTKVKPALLLQLFARIICINRET